MCPLLILVVKVGGDSILIILVFILTPTLSRPLEKLGVCDKGEGVFGFSCSKSNTFLLVARGFSWPKEPLVIDLILRLSCKYYKGGS